MPITLKASENTKQSERRKAMLSTEINAAHPVSPINPVVCLSAREIHKAISSLDEETLSALQWHQQQVQQLACEEAAFYQQSTREVVPGIISGYKYTPLKRVGCIIPYSKRPVIHLTHQCVVSAKVAKVDRVIVCIDTHQQQPCPVTVAAAALAGADEIYCLNELSAIHMLCSGGDTQAPVDLIIGESTFSADTLQREMPDNESKGHIHLLHPAQFTLILVDEFGCNPEHAVLDVFKQISASPCDRLTLLTHSKAFADKLLNAIHTSLKTYPTAHSIHANWQQKGAIIQAESIDEMVVIADDSHWDLIKVMTANPKFFLDHLHNYGRILLGKACNDALVRAFFGSTSYKISPHHHPCWLQQFFKVHTYQQVNPLNSALHARHCQRIMAIENHDDEVNAADSLQGTTVNPRIKMQ